jgi:hypothetical protein
VNNIKYFNYTGNISRNGLYRCNECSKQIRNSSIKNIFSNEEKKNKILSKTRNTNIERYGFTSPMKNEDIKNISKQSNIRIYGVDNPMKCDDVKNRFNNSIFEKYGVEHYSKTDEYKIKYRNTCLKKYGCENSFQDISVKNKIKVTLLDRYGVDNPTKNTEIFNKAQKQSYKILKHDNIELLYQGTYELDFINYCILNSISIERGPTIDYSLNFKSRKYHSDFYLPYYNLICEVKSSWTYMKDKDENLAKEEYSKKSGYNFLFIMDKKYSELKEYLNL